MHSYKSKSKVCTVIDLCLLPSTPLASPKFLGTISDCLKQLGTFLYNLVLNNVKHNDMKLNILDNNNLPFRSQANYM